MQVEFSAWMVSGSCRKDGLQGAARPDIWKLLCSMWDVLPSHYGKAQGTGQRHRPVPQEQARKERRC